MRHKLVPYSRVIRIFGWIIFGLGLYLLSQNLIQASIFAFMFTVIFHYQGLIYDETDLNQKDSRMILYGVVFSGILFSILGFGEFEQFSHLKVEGKHLGQFFVLTSLTTLTFAGAGASILGSVAADISNKSPKLASTSNCCNQKLRKVEKSLQQLKALVLILTIFVFVLILKL